MSLAFPGWRLSRSGLLPCRDDGAGPGSSQNPGKTSSGKQPVRAWGAVPCRGQAETSPGRILLFPERFSSRDGEAPLPEDAEPGLSLPPARPLPQLCDGSLKALIKALNPPPSPRPGGNKGRWKGLERASVPGCARRAPGDIAVPREHQRGAGGGPWVVSSCPQGPSSAARWFILRGARWFWRRRGRCQRGRAPAALPGWAPPSWRAQTVTLQGSRSPLHCRLGVMGTPRRVTRQLGVTRWPRC